MKNAWGEWKTGFFEEVHGTQDVKQQLLKRWRKMESKGAITCQI